MEQGSLLWRKFREKCDFTSSGVSKKLFDIGYPESKGPPSEKTKEIMQYGTDNEKDGINQVLIVLNKTSKDIHFPSIAVHQQLLADHGILLAGSPDGIIENALVEVKCPFMERKESIGRPRLHHLVQVINMMEIMNLDKTYLYYNIPENREISVLFIVPRQEQIWKEAIEPAIIGKKKVSKEESRDLIHSLLSLKLHRIGVGQSTFIF